MPERQPGQAESMGELPRRFAQHGRLLTGMVKLREQDIGGDVEEPDPAAESEYAPNPPAQGRRMVIRQFAPVIIEEQHPALGQRNQARAEVGKPGGAAAVARIDQGKLSRQKAE